jgi:hypothetical protein
MARAHRNINYWMSSLSDAETTASVDAVQSLQCTTLG